MELQLGLRSLPTYNFIENFDLNNDGFEPKDQMLGSKPWISCEDGHNMDNKRSFEVAYGKNTRYASRELPLLLWSGQPNDEDWNGEKKISCSINKNGEEENRVEGWPPINSWRKKVLHHDQDQARHVMNSSRMAAAGNYENGDGSNSKYVKVKMEGVAITRKIDLRLYNSYQTLTKSLTSMFAKCQNLGNDAARYSLTYQDKDGDWLVAGDVPWQSFMESVQRLKIVRNAG